MWQNIKHRQYLQPVRASGGVAETSTFDWRQLRSEKVPGLRMAFTPASQGHLAAVEQVPTAAAFSSVCNRAIAWMTLAGDRRPRFALRIWETSISHRFFFCPASQGKVAVVGPVPAAATSLGSEKKRGLAVEIVPGGRPR
ncbi:hypothetical protein [Rhizobium giardinii]|uniref:Uncharacterized protein n=1 Tax=Rhizobium giardinii TaxID=56731 RepID=A0A7W8UHL9_9HYPH|nr:hypothetical protein [Rhizobium giardinii]MBB5538767.1 hypothetical protein [Rhizobium giardinii]